MSVVPTSFPPAVTQWIAFTSSLQGRDKLIRTVQYFCKFYAWFLERKGAPKADFARYAGVTSSLSTTRKAIRVGKFVDQFQSALKAHASIADDLTRWFAVLKAVSYGLWLIFDLQQYVRIKSKEDEAKRAELQLLQRGERAGAAAVWWLRWLRWLRWCGASRGPEPVIRTSSILVALPNPS
jgi:hypothetical protein